MDDQLVLLDDNETGLGGRSATAGDRYRRLDEQTREVGRRGVARAREALRQAATRAA